MLRVRHEIFWNNFCKQTVSTLAAWFLAMVRYPEVYKKAQAELDTIVGNTRLPTLEDRPQLEYIERIIQETLRWCPVAPIGQRATHVVDN